MAPHLILLLTHSEPVSGWSAVLYLILVILVTIVGLAIGAFIFVRVLAWIINQKRDEWIEAADHLGLTIEKHGGIKKNMTGTYRGYPVTVSFFSIVKPTGDYYSTDECAVAEVIYDAELPFSFRLERRENLWNRLANRVFGDEDFAGLEDDFDLQISDTDGAMRLLSVEMPDGERPTLLGDINFTHNTFQRIIISDRSISLGLRTRDDVPGKIKFAMDRSIYLAERIRSAAKLIAADS